MGCVFPGVEAGAIAAIFRLQNCIIVFQIYKFMKYCECTLAAKAAKQKLET